MAWPTYCRWWAELRAWDRRFQQAVSFTRARDCILWSTKEVFAAIELLPHQLRMAEEESDYQLGGGSDTQ
jgi:hypothetical protein